MLNILSWISLIYIILCTGVNFSGIITSKTINKRLASLCGTIITAIMSYVLYQYMFII